MIFYVIKGILDDVVILGITRSKVTAESQRDKINQSGGIGYCQSEVWIEKYQLNEDNYVELD